MYPVFFFEVSKKKILINESGHGENRTKDLRISRFPN